MARIRVEWVPIQNFYLGYFGFHHLHIALEQDETNIRQKQDHWYVMEGLRDATVSPITLGVLGWDGETSLAAANQAFDEELVAKIGTPEQRGSRALSVIPDALSAWATMTDFATEIEDQHFPYFAFSTESSPRPIFNSSSVVGSLLFYGGADPALSMPLDLGWSPGTKTLLGTTGDDELEIQSHFNTLGGGIGNDQLFGSNEAIKIEKLYGGQDNDIITWSAGVNIIHGGHPTVAYTDDGTDVIDYSGVGEVTIRANKFAIEHKTPDYTTTFEGGSDMLFSIERLRFDEKSDVVKLKGGARLLEEHIILDLGTEQQGYGDRLSFSEVDAGLEMVAATDGSLFVQQTASDSDKGMWLRSLEWVSGSSSADVIYGGAELDRIEGDAGDDLIDTRLASPFTDDTPLGYDVEIDGGEGNDTIVSNEGHTIATGGGGADRFVLGAMTSGGGTVEFVISDAAAEDRLFVPLDFFDGAGGDYQDSALMPLLGAIGTYDLMVDGNPLYLTATLRNTYLYGSDLTEGVIPFVGMVEYMLDGADLVINVARGYKETTNVEEEGEPERYLTQTVIVMETLTTIRITDYSQGDLGIEFHDPGQPTAVQLGGGRIGFNYPNWDAAVMATTNNGSMTQALDARPASPTYEDPDADENAPQQLGGTEDGEIIVAIAKSTVRAGGGDDDITGSAADDAIDGGSGNDIMQGGGGDDSFVVDGAGDVVVENASGGIDSVVSSIDYVLPDFVEHLSLTGGAAAGTGNAGANRLVGSDVANTLSGLEGSDTLDGGAGDDVLIGGEGADGYIYMAGEGSDRIVDVGLAGEVDTLLLVEFAPSDITLHRSADGADLVVSTALGGRITIADYAVAGRGIDRIEFAGEAVWLRDEIIAAAAASPMLVNDPPQAVEDHGHVIRGHAIVVPAAALLGNDRSYDSDPLSIAAVAAASIGTVTLTSGGDVLVEIAAGTTGPLSFNYTISDGNGGTSTGQANLIVVANAAPVAAQALPGQTATSGQAWSYLVPEAAFSDADQEPLALSARLQGGAALPAWLSFDGETRTLAGTPPSGGAQTLAIEIVASDGAAVAVNPLTLTIVGSAPGVTVSGTSADERLVGGAGDDTFLVVGHGGYDTIVAGDGFDRIVGSVYNDVFGVKPATAWHGVEAIDGGEGFDRIDGTNDGDVIDLSSYVLTSVEVIDGRGGNDTIIGSAGSDTIRGHTGDDTLSGSGGDDTFLVAGDGGNDTIDGGGGFDALVGSAYNDVFRFFGSGGNFAGIELIDGGAGANDKILGSAGDDVVDLSAITIANVELIDGGTGNDTIGGSAGADTLAGGVGNDTLSGGGGDDIFLVVGDGGFDVIDGGAGYDRVVGSVFNDVIRVTSGLNNIAGIEALDGGAGTDRIEATGGADVLDFSGLALSGIEKIDAGAGNDRLTGSGGADFLVGGTGNDTFVFVAGGGADTVLDFHLGTAAQPVVDVLDLSAFAYATFADVLASASQAGADTVIDLGGGDTVRLANISVASLQADDLVL